jgi:hypothetical protein
MGSRWNTSHFTLPLLTTDIQVFVPPRQQSLHPGIQKNLVTGNCGQEVTACFVLAFEKKERKKKKKSMVQFTTVPLKTLT